MKAQLIFELPEDEASFEIASKAQELYSEINEFEGEIRRLYKYSNQTSIKIEELKEMFYRVFESYSALNR